VEHRCGFRRSSRVEVLIRNRSGHIGEGTVLNVSASGALVETRLPLAPHSRVFLQFSRSTAQGRSRRVSVEAEVIRQDELGVGVEWVEFSPKGARDLYQSDIQVKDDVATAL
jgi:PilZ domain-containing protein